MRNDIYVFCKRYLKHCQRDENEFTTLHLGIKFNFKNDYYSKNSDILPFLCCINESSPRVVKLFKELDKSNLLYSYIKLIISIYEKRRKDNIFAIDLAKKANIPEVTYNRMENFVTIPRLDNILAVMVALNLNNFKI